MSSGVGVGEGADERGGTKSTKNKARTIPPPPPGSLERRLEYLYGERGIYGNLGPCLCDHGWRHQGRLYATDMGYGWSRTTTHPDCPNHGVAEQARLKKKRKR
jgi:hypothetical protein